MGNILTSRYSSSSFKQGFTKPITFARDVYRSGKSRELTSFLIWEVSHKLGLFPKKSYLNFSNHQVISIGDENFGSDVFDQSIVQSLGSLGLRVIPSTHNWKLLYFINGEIYGCLYPEDKDLYRVPLVRVGIIARIHSGQMQELIDSAEHSITLLKNNLSKK